MTGMVGKDIYDLILSKTAELNEPRLYMNDKLEGLKKKQLK